MDSMLRPMLASLADASLTDPQLIYEPKYDGIRAIAEVDRGHVRLWSRLGNEKTAQFPEIVEGLRKWARRLRAPVVVDGEIVALDEHSEPTGFQQLQGRIHLTEQLPPEATSGRTAFIAFDLLRDGATDLRERPLVERRTALERILGRATTSLVRISETVRGDGRALYERALDSGWEGIIAKHADSKYKSGKRTPDWRKLKIVHEQEFVIGGWTEPRQTRTYFGALLLGVYQGSGRTGQGSGRRDQGSDALIYVGHTGTGFNEAELGRVMKWLRPIETTTCPFQPRPKTNERPHWVEPKLVAQIKFTEWTADGKLRHPVYLGLRDDKKPTEVRREPVGRLHTTSEVRRKDASSTKPSTTDKSSSQTAVVSGFSRTKKRANKIDGVSGFRQADVDALVEQLRELEHNRRDGMLTLPDGDHLSVSNLHKVFWPREQLTKGDLFRYYVQVAPFILPAIADRPLTMKRLPNGIAGQTFYQHRAPDHVPDRVRVESVPGEKTVPARFIGGDLKTLLFMTQLAAISQDPWFSRIGAVESADHVALDLDPSEGVAFGRVLDVARWIGDELETLGVVGVPKTSGADGLHVYLPLPPGTPYEAGLIVCQIIATVVARDHPKVATVERSVKARGPRVYVDYLQNVLGKTLATAYSARASEYAGVSTPLTWNEVDRGIRREDFTIRTIPERLRRVGDLWEVLRTSDGIDLSKIAGYAEGRQTGGHKSRGGRTSARRTSP
jgi:bifunctional non-homologous end joining protein LigD